MAFPFLPFASPTALYNPSREINFKLFTERCSRISSSDIVAANNFSLWEYQRQKHGQVVGGEAILKWTSFAPASKIISFIFLDVVPLTTESSTRIMVVFN